MVFTRKDGKFRTVVNEAFDPYGTEGFSHIQENRAGLPPLVEVSVDAFNKEGQLQRRAVPVSEPKLLATQQPALAYFSDDPSE
jgi:hypothetical protein